MFLNSKRWNQISYSSDGEWTYQLTMSWRTWQIHSSSFDGLKPLHNYFINKSFKYFTLGIAYSLCIQVCPALDAASTNHFWSAFTWSRQQSSRGIPDSLPKPTTVPAGSNGQAVRVTNLLASSNTRVSHRIPRWNPSSTSYLHPTDWQSRRPILF